MPWFTIKKQAAENGHGGGFRGENNPSEPASLLKAKTLKDVKIGESGIVIQINAKGPLRRRFMDMGITRGTEIQVLKYAPLGDPMELRLRDYVLSIRKSEAELIIVQD